MGDPNLLRVEPEYTMQVVTDRTGVPGHTIRSWERRHGFPVPERGDANQRLYSERDIHFISWIREQSEQGQQVSASIRQLQHQGTATHLAREPSRVEPSTPSSASRPEGGVIRYAERPNPDRRPGGNDRMAAALDSLTSFEPGPFRQILRDRLAFDDPAVGVFEVVVAAGRQLEAQRQRGMLQASNWKYAHGWLRDQVVALLHVTDAAVGRGRVVGARLLGSVDDLILLCHLLEMSRAGMHVVHFSLALTPSELLSIVEEYVPTIVVLASDDESGAWEAAQVGRRISQQQDAARLGYCGRGFEEHPEVASSLFGSVLRPTTGAYRSLLDTRPRARVIEVING